MIATIAHLKFKTVSPNTICMYCMLYNDPHHAERKEMEEKMEHLSGTCAEKSDEGGGLASRECVR